jgi:DNA-binding response OmpR family regulator
MRFLVIQDQADTKRTLAARLHKQGYAVDVAQDRQQGYELVRTYDYDLLIFDIGSSGTKGLEICRHLRMEQPSLPIFLITAKKHAQHRAIGLDAGADDCLSKPFNWGEFVARLRALLRRDIVARKPTLECKDLTLDTSARIAFLGQQRLALTAKEFAILEYLLRHPAQVVSQQELLEHAWDASANSFTNVVRVHINSLRRKLGDNASNPRYIETVTGSGYRMCTASSRDR